MPESLKESVVKAVQCVGQLSLSASGLPFPADAEDVEAWKNPSTDGGQRLLARGGKSLRAFLRMLRNHRDLLEAVMWQGGVSVDLPAVDLLLTQAAVEASARAAWVRLRLAVFQAYQEDANRPEVLFLLDALKLDGARLVLLRDAAILDHFGCDAGTPGVDKDSALATAMSWLQETVDADLRGRLLSQDSLRASLKAIGLDVDGVLMLDAALGFLARIAPGADRRAAKLGALVVQALAAGEPIDSLLPGADWAELKRQLIDGTTDLMASLCDAALLAETFLRAAGAGEALGPVAASWVRQTHEEFWAPFRSAVLRPGAVWTSDALNLLAAIGAIHRPGQELPGIVRRFEIWLNLQETLAEGSRLDQLVRAVKDFDAAAFHAAAFSGRAGDITVDVLCESPSAGEEELAPLGFTDVSAMVEHVRQQVEQSGVTCQSDSPAGKVLFDLVAVAMGSRREDQGRLLEAIVGSPDIGMDKGRTVRLFVTGDRQIADSVTARGMLGFCRRNRTWLVDYLPDIDRRISELMKAQYEELHAQIGGAARTALALVWQVLSGQASESDVVRQYGVDHPTLARLQEDFLEGRTEPLARQVEHRLHAPLLKWQEPEYSLWKALRDSWAVRTYAAALVVLIGGYLTLHGVLTGRSRADPRAPQSLQAAPVPPKDVLQVLDLVESNVPSTGRPAYIGRAPIPYKEYTRWMGEPRVESHRAVASAATQPVSFVSFEEARAFCRSLTSYLYAEYPEAFQGDRAELKGYACRLPTAAEAKAMPPVVGASPADAEWVLPDRRDNPGAQDAVRLFAQNPVVLFGAGESKAQQRPPPEGKTTFRIVLAPEGPAAHERR